MAVLTNETLEALVSDYEYLINNIHNFHSDLEETKRDLKQFGQLDEWQAESQNALIRKAETLLVRIAEQVSKATKDFKSQSFLDQSGRIISKDYVYQEKSKQETHLSRQGLLNYYSDLVIEKKIDLKRIYSIQQFLNALGENKKSADLTSAKKFVINFLIKQAHK
jgi:hypothetical protein